MRPPDDGGSPVPELELARNFPGIEDDGRDPYVDHTEVRRIVTRLREQLGALRGSAPANMSATWSGPGTIGEVSGLGNVGPAETGSWEVASNFGFNTEQAYRVFGGSYGELVDYVERWADAVERAIANYEQGHADSSA